jgi:hypothetical protein
LNPACRTKPQQTLLKFCFINKYTCELTDPGIRNISTDHHEKNRESISAAKDMCRLRKALHLAEKMGEGMG